MAEVVLPRQGWTMEVGSVVEWHKRDGDRVREGDVILTIQSDKATHEVEALDSGILRIPPDSPAPGVEVPIGTVLAHIEPDDTAPTRPSAPDVAPTRAPAPRSAATPPAATAAHTPAPPATSAPGPGAAPTSVPAAAPTPAPDPLVASAPVTTRPPEPIAPAPRPPEPSSPSSLLAVYRTMLLIRRTEEGLARLHQQGLVHGACHTYVGEEAIAAGVCAHLRPDDTVFSTHRGHGHALAKGVPPRELMAELLGRETGCAHGRGGSMHLFKPEVGLLGTSGIVGPSILLAAGSAYAFKLNKTDRVSVAFFGDGASNNGAFHEGINMATIWGLPVLFVCENNQYATEIAYKNVSRVLDVSAKAAGYGLPGVTVDGNDAAAVHGVAGEAVRRARAGEGPTLIECKTYRTRAHSEGMRDVGYRTPDEVDSWRARDPIPRLRAQLLAQDEDAAAVEAEVEAEVAEAADFAKNSPWPDPSTVTRHVYAEGAG